MQVDDAVEWVTKNTALIAKMAESYCSYAPYDASDYINDAYSAAIVAANRCRQNPSLNFRQLFFQVFRETVAETTPFPTEKKIERLKRLADQGKLSEEKFKDKMSRVNHYSGNTSQSIPISGRHDDAVLENLPEKKTKKINIEKVYQDLVRPKLSPREAEVMDLVLGTTMEGSLNPSEVAEKLGVSRRSVRTLTDRAYQKASLINMQEAKERLREHVPSQGPVLEEPEEPERLMYHQP